MTPRSVGVEEELLLVDPDSGRARALSPAVLRNARLSGEHPTVEVRIADVCLFADDAVVLVALVRGLVDTAAPAGQVIGKLLDHVGPALEELGDREMVNELITTVLKRGNGATVQRQINRSSGQLAEVVAHAVRGTTS